MFHFQTTYFSFLAYERTKQCYWFPYNWKRTHRHCQLAHFLGVSSTVSSTTELGVHLKRALCIGMYWMLLIKLCISAIKTFYPVVFGIKSHSETAFCLQYAVAFQLNDGSLNTSLKCSLHIRSSHDLANYCKVTVTVNANIIWNGCTEYSFDVFLFFYRFSGKKKREKKA